MFNILVQRFTVLLIKNYKIQLPALLFFAGLLELHQQIYIFYKFVGFYSTLMYSIVKGTTSPQPKSTKCDKCFLSVLMLPKSRTDCKFVLYCFQLQLVFSLNLILEIKYLLHFLPFVLHMHKRNLSYGYTDGLFLVM